MIDRLSHLWIGAGQLSRLVLILCAALAVSACAQNESSNLFNFGPIAENTSSSATSNMTPEQAVAHYSGLYGANPRDKTNSLRYAESLRKVGNKKRALSILRASAGYHSEDQEVLSSYGRATLANGQASTAARILAKADNPDRPDWRTVSARGTAYAQLGEYKMASQQFERALKLAPGNASVMSNLAMAKAATGDLRTAESLLKKASQMPIIDPKIKQNLALVLRLQGRKKEAEKLENKRALASQLRKAVPPAQSEEPGKTKIALAKKK